MKTPPSILPLIAALSLSGFAGPAAADIQARALQMILGRSAPVALVEPSDNRVSVHQTGDNNRVFVRQHGSGHSADITQLNGDNTLFVVQTGRRSSVTTTQHGGEQGFIFVYGH